MLLVLSEVGADNAVKEDDKTTAELELPPSAQVVIHTASMRCLSIWHPVCVDATPPEADKFTILRYWAWRQSVWRRRNTP